MDEAQRERWRREIVNRKSFSGNGKTKMEQLAPAWPRPTLAVLAAKTLAKAWSCDKSLMPDFCKTTDSQTNIIFKVQVAIFLKGTYLVKWIQSQGGLAQISALVWSHLFQFLLTSVFLEISNIETPPRAKKLLTDIIKEYDDIIKEATQLNHVLHRLGLTSAFYHCAFLHETEKNYWNYYEYQQYQWHSMDRKIPIVFPLPFVLQSCTVEKRKPFLQCSPDIEKRKLEWRQKGIIQEESWSTLQQQRSLKKNFDYLYNTWERHLVCLLVMTRSKVLHSYQVTLLTAFMSLLEPYYSINSPNNLLRPFDPNIKPDTLGDEKHFIFLKQCRIDIFWNMSCALGSFYAKLDLVLACLKKARDSIGARPGLSDRMRYAVMYQNVVINYGHWEAAQKNFSTWFYRVPSASWLFEELLFNFILGGFWQIENLLMEIYITKVFHTHCRKETCWDKHIRSSYFKVNEIKIQLYNAIYECIHDPTIHKRFENNLKFIIRICTFFDITQNKIEHNCTNVFKQSLRYLKLQLHNEKDHTTSSHFYSFVDVLPYHLTDPNSWDVLIQANTTWQKEQQQEVTKANMPRRYADHLFSLLVSNLYHNKVGSFTRLISLTLEAYEKCTAHRHYRIPLLKRLLEVCRQPEKFHLKPNYAELDVHAQVPNENISAIGMTLQDIEKFSATLQDGHDDFKHVDLSNDEKFFLYLKNRDHLFLDWIHFGFNSLCFAKVI